jgi:hypothetical protein
MTKNELNEIEIKIRIMQIAASVTFPDHDIKKTISAFESICNEFGIVLIEKEPKDFK